MPCFPTRFTPSSVSSLVWRECRVSAPWQRRPRPRGDPSSGTFGAGDPLQLCSLFFPAAEEGMCCGVTQGEAGRIWQWTMDKPLHNIHYVLGWNVSKLDARSPNSPFLWTGALLFIFFQQRSILSPGNLQQKNVLLKRLCVETASKGCLNINICIYIFFKRMAENCFPL